MVIDDAEMYFLNFEGDTPTEAGGTHIGMFLGWAMLRGLASAEMAARLPAFLSREQTGRDLLFRHCDGKLMASDLGARASAFAEHYYHAGYLQDYLRMFQLKDDPFDLLADVPDSWSAQLAVIERLDRRYSEWRMSQGMPSRQVLHDALVQAAAPVLEAAGFVPEPKSGYDAYAVRTTFVQAAGWQTPRVSLYGAGNPDQFYGVGVELGFSIRELYLKAEDERQLDDARWSMSGSWTVEMPMSSLAAGWQGPAALRAYYPSLWIFEESELEPAVGFLANRLRDFALPALARIHSIATFCDACDTHPLTASPWFRSWADYTLPLAFELCGHASLPRVVDEMEAYWRQHPEVWGSVEMRSFLTRLRGRIGDANR